MNVIVSNIKWDAPGNIETGRLTEGKQLPEVVLVLNAPEDDSETKDILSDLLSDEFGFTHHGFEFDGAENYQDLTHSVDAIVQIKN